MRPQDAKCAPFFCSSCRALSVMMEEAETADRVSTASIAIRMRFRASPLLSAFIGSRGRSPGTRDCRSRPRTCAKPTDKTQVRGREAAGLRQSSDLLTCFQDSAQQARRNPGR